MLDLDLRFGVNYVPTTDWYYGLWTEFDRDAIKRNLDAIAGLGLDHIRLMCLWPLFMPDRRWVDPRMLERLRALVDLAGERGLDCCVTALNGWLTGCQFKPPFDLGRNLYENEDYIRSQERYLDAVTGVLADSPHLLGIDLGNELNCCWYHPDLAVGDAWMERMLDRCRAAVPEGIHVNGVDHQPWFGPQTFSPAALAAQPVITLHSWIRFTGALKRGDHRQPCCTHLAAAMADLARAHAADPQRPVWIQEFGASEEWMPADDIPDFCRSATTAAWRQGVNMFTWWCSHDISRQFGVDSLEYSLGLFDVDNREKPVAAALREVVAELRAAGRQEPPATLPPPPAIHDHEHVWAWLDERIASYDLAARV